MSLRDLELIVEDNTDNDRLRSEVRELKDNHLNLVRVLHGYIKTNDKRLESQAISIEILQQQLRSMRPTRRTLWQVLTGKSNG